MNPLRTLPLLALALAAAGCARGAASGTSAALAPLAATSAPESEPRGGSGLSASEEAGETDRTPDVMFVPTPEAVVRRMLELGKVGPGDVVYDLGSGDGRIVISAVRDFGAARGVGIDIDPTRIEEARENAGKAGVGERVEFREEDLFEVDLGEADVVTLYLLQTLNERLRPRLQRLAPGTRIVSHSFSMGDWEPDHTEVVEGQTVYLWIVR